MLTWWLMPVQKANTEIERINLSVVESRQKASEEIAKARDVSAQEVAKAREQAAAENQRRSERSIRRS
ncbi:MAG: hypothetical protein R2769_13960 [Saprospiraceae bacterium]